MKILGIHDGHNATAALFQDGHIVACASEERFTRLKIDMGYPYHAVNYVLQAAGLKPGEVDYVALASLTADPIQNRLKREATFSIADYVREMHEYWKPLLYENRTTDFWDKLLHEPRFQHDNLYYDYSFMETTPRDEWNERYHEMVYQFVANHTGVPRERIQRVEHHVAHAAYAYYASPRCENAVVITADSWGDDCNATISIVKDGKLQEIRRTALCNIARVYRFITLLLGMRPMEHEYKVMGLAPYAKDYVLQPAYQVFKKILAVDGLDFRWLEKPTDMYFHFQRAFEGVRFDAIAGGLQKWTEELLAEWVTNILAETGADTIYYSGGLAMNVKANMMIQNLPNVKNVFVPASGGDESLAIGAVYALAVEQGEQPQPLRDVYLGAEPDPDEIATIVSELSTHHAYTIITQPQPDDIAKLLAQGAILSRCVGRMEFGARALGNRSIICDPSQADNIRIINEKVKSRDFWMPFAPSILHERRGDYLVNPRDDTADFMTIAFDTTPLAKKHLRAALHPYDFTARPQLVKQTVNPEYHALIKAFENLTGIGAVLNTSFNLHGDPIVQTAREALDTFIRSDLDGLIFPNVLILKRRDS